MHSDASDVSNSITAAHLKLKHTCTIVTVWSFAFPRGGTKSIVVLFCVCVLKVEPQLGWGYECCCSTQHLFLWFGGFFSPPPPLLIVPPVYYADAWIARCSQLYRTSCTLLPFVFCQLPWEKEGRRGGGCVSQSWMCVVCVCAFMKLFYVSSIFTGVRHVFSRTLLQEAIYFILNCNIFF